MVSSARQLLRFFVSTLTPTVVLAEASAIVYGLLLEEKGAVVVGAQGWHLWWLAGLALLGLISTLSVCMLAATKVLATHSTTWDSLRRLATYLLAPAALNLVASVVIWLCIIWWP